MSTAPSSRCDADGPTANRRKLGCFFGNGTELWLNMQTAYDRWEVEGDDELRDAAQVEPVQS